MKRILFALFVLFSFGLAFTGIPILVARHHAISLQRELTPAMGWAQFATILDSNKKWDLVSFRGDENLCGMVARRDDKYSLIVRPKDQTLRARETTIPGMADSLVVEQSTICPQLTIFFLAGTSPATATFRVELGPGGQLAVIEPVTVYGP